MRSSGASEEKPVEQGGKLRACKAKPVVSQVERLEHVSSDSTEHNKAEQALRESEEKYRDLFENAAEGIITIDLKARITSANKLVEEYGFDRHGLIGKKLFDFVPEYDRARAVSDFEILLGGKTVKGQMDVITPKGTITVEYRDNPIVRQGQVIGVQAILTNITERKRAEQLVRKEKDRAQKYLDVAAVMLVAIDCEQRVGLINKKGCKILGYEEEEILAKNWFDNFLPETIRDEVRNIFEKTVRREIDPPEYCENLILTKGGQERLIAWHNTILQDEKGEVVAILGSGEDITERKKGEEKLLDYQRQLKSLASRLTLAEERERRRIATELHDRISQSLVISKIKLDGLRHSVSCDEPAKVLEEVCESLGQAIADTRSLTFDLSSPILYELGLGPAVDAWLLEQIKQKYEIATELEEDDEPKPLDDDIRAILFRDVRELLINVVKHSRATKVKVSIRRVGDQIRVDVEDDGVGFDATGTWSTTTRKGGFGLFSIRERLEQLGGHFQLESAPGQGCKATILAPLKQE